MLNLYMFYSRMQCWIFRKTNDKFFITKDINFTLIDVVVPKLILYPKELSTIAYNCHVFYFSNGQCSRTFLFAYLCNQVSTNEMETSTCVLLFDFVSNIVSITEACEPEIFPPFEQQTKIRNLN